MATLRARVENLEASASANGHSDHCLVVHSADCEKDRAAAGAAYAEEHGYPPTRWINVYIVSSTTKRRVCGCIGTLLDQAI